MRIWSLHPRYLDPKGLVALWRETLLAKHVLEGRTKGYRHHPQLTRFRQSSNPKAAINFYLQQVWEEAARRGYHFDHRKFSVTRKPPVIPVTNGQVAYEKGHLLAKLRKRDPPRYAAHLQRRRFDVHPSFRLVRGAVEPWERT